MRDPRARRRRGSDHGFSLIETMVAIGIAMVMFTALGSVSLAALHSVVLSRQNQQAVDILNRAIEHARALSFANVTMKTSDLTGDPAITGTPAKYAVPNGVGPEVIDARAVGAVVRETTESPDGKTTFTVRRYVTLPPGVTYDVSGLPSIRRLTTVVSWRVYGQNHERVASTILTDTRRGLPLPNYVFQTVGASSATKSPGATLDFGLRVRNLGARDAFNLSASAGTWNYYLDPNANGVRDTGEDSLLGNVDAAAGNLEPDTGMLEPGASITFVAQRTVGALESGTTTVTFKTVSVAQPTVTEGTKTTNVLLTVQTGSVTSGSCPGTPPGALASGGTTLNSFFFTNRPVGNTTTQTSNVMARADCTMQSADRDFSTEDPGRSIGRIIRPGGSSGNVAANVAAEWRYQVPVSTKVQGTAVMTFQFRCTSSTGPTTSGSVTFTGFFGTRANNSNTLNGLAVISSASSAVLSCPSSGWATVSIPMSLATANTLAANKWLAVRLVTSSSSSQVLVNYDSPNAVSFISIPVAP